MKLLRLSDKVRAARSIPVRAIVMIGVLASLGCSLAAGSVDLPAPTPTDVPITPTESATATPAPTDTPEPTNTPTITPLPPTDTPEPTPDPYVPVTRNADWTPIIETFDGVEMALVPAGCFEMGSADGDNDEWPVHEVCFEEPFWIDVYEVTNGQLGEDWARCRDRSAEDNQPGICINWHDSVVHCESRGGRLPTEAEWEYAARGPDGLIYPWGNDFIADNLVYDENDPGGTAPVGSKPDGVSWVGAYDLSGNVWEWINDWYWAYSPRQQINPQGPESGSSRVIRGGSWADDASHNRAANRNWDYPSDTDYNIVGFRCAMAFQP
ncbi:MAG: formylglycine-generating enzyme family protein [Anaerolineae bacterium]|nr:formylglycine-generating enzyme family protein [Anaerolineae bacterium]